MSETMEKGTDTEIHSESSNSKGPVQECIREKYQKETRKNSRPYDYKRNRGSYNLGYRNDNFGRRATKRNWSHSQQDGKRKKFEVGNRLKEVDVGITEFMGDKGLFGVIKERFTDFHVNEIDLDGQIVKLTKQDIPIEEEEHYDLDDLKNTVSDEIWNQLHSLKDPEAPAIDIDVTNVDKEQRKAIHKIAKMMTNVISQTIDKENKKIMVIMPQRKNNRSSHNFRKDNRVDWKQRGGEYCHFVLHKVNMDTMDTLNQLAMNLRVKPNNFNYAGTKDRRAWTSQWISLRRAEPSDIQRAARNIRGAFVGNFKFTKRPLQLGMLKGNHFRIALRNVSGTDQEIEKVMSALADQGFINYYGLQRFGTVAAIPTQEIGKALLQRKWNEAIELILKPREGEQDKDLAEARKIYETTKDADTAYRRMKRCDKIEARLLKGLSVTGNNNPQGALDYLPRNVRLMYVHAYQSYVWNLMVSRRLKEYGRKPIVGDLVYENNGKCNDDEDEFVYDNENEVEATNNTESNEKLSKKEIETDAEEKMGSGPKTEIEERNAISAVTDATQQSLKIDDHTELSKTTVEKDETEDSRNLPAVKILEAEDLPNYTLSDVLMPQVGWKVTYPPYAKPWFDDLLGKDGLTTDLRQKNRKYSLGGAYRKILEIPTNLSWRIMHYKEKHSDLIMCDIDEMRKSSGPKDEPEGQYKALIVEMSLKSSTYATMALREILKFDTSPQAQAAQFAASHPEEKVSDTSKEPAGNGHNTHDTCKNVNTQEELMTTEQETEDNNAGVLDAM